MLSFNQYLTESKRSDIANLQADSKIQVFHGSDLATITYFLENGIDSRKPHPRLYPHYAGGKKVVRGLYVSPDYDTARRFGRVVIAFTVLGKDLYPMYGTKDTLRAPSDFVKEKYPKSFRPEVSFDMLDRGAGSESQALFIGLLSPRAITKMWNDGVVMSPTVAIKTIVEPQDKTFDVESLIQYVEKNYRHLKRPEIIELLKTNHLDSLGLNIPYTVTKRLMQQIKKL